MCSYNCNKYFVGPSSQGLLVTMNCTNLLFLTIQCA
uniref:Uncharacterized protein n=1 Tax=Anguilla anguilla TaxID=7936 RepID=A0A0E9V6I0_ANGAN